MNNDQANIEANQGNTQNQYFDYDYAVWFETAKQLLNRKVKITQAQNAFQNEFGWINDVLSPDGGKSWNRILVQPERDPNVLVELGQGDYVLQPLG
jgi:hypothetical protein